MTAIALGFVPEPITVSLDRILPSRKVPAGLATSRKFRQVKSSIEEVGLIEPLSVAALDAASAITHFGPGGRDLPGPKPVLFFAPAQVKKRSADWGPAVFGQRLVQAWHAFRAQAGDAAAPWVVVHQHQGRQAVQAAHALVLAGRGDARLGHMLSLAGADVR